MMNEHSDRNEWYHIPPSKDGRPFDGKRYLLWDGRGLHSGIYHLLWQKWLTTNINHAGGFPDYIPTHYREFPEPPEEREAMGIEILLEEKQKLQQAMDRLWGMGIRPSDPESGRNPNVFPSKKTCGDCISEITLGCMDFRFQIKNLPYDMSKSRQEKRYSVTAQKDPAHTEDFICWHSWNVRHYKLGNVARIDKQWTQDECRYNIHDDIANRLCIPERIRSCTATTWWNAIQIVMCIITHFIKYDYMNVITHPIEPEVQPVIGERDDDETTNDDQSRAGLVAGSDRSADPSGVWHEQLAEVE
jgi:hypothetical protein